MPDLRQQFPPGIGQPDERLTIEPLVPEETTVVGFLPHWKSRAGGAPGIQYFFVSSLARVYPLEQVEDERFHDSQNTP